MVHASELITPPIICGSDSGCVGDHPDVHREPNVGAMILGRLLHACTSRQPHTAADRGSLDWAPTDIDVIAVDLPSPNVGGSC